MHRYTYIYTDVYRYSSACCNACCIVCCSARCSAFCTCVAEFVPVAAVKPTVAVPEVNLRAYFSDNGMLIIAVSISVCVCVCMSVCLCVPGRERKTVRMEFIVCTN